MKIQGLLTDRKKLVEALERETGLKAKYCGAPSFKYTIGDCTVYRDGSLECEDSELIKRLTAEGLLQDNADESPITFPAEMFTAKALVNLVNCIAAREKFLNKAVDQPCAFHVTPALVRELKIENPSTIPEFMNAVFRSGGEKTMRGFRITMSAVSFPGFPDTPTFRCLAECMVNAALTQGWIKPVVKKTVNEKYTVRVWLMAIGMKGDQYKEARAEILSRFEGDSTFRTEEQKKAFEQKRKKKKVEPDFVVL